MSSFKLKRIIPSEIIGIAGVVVALSVGLYSPEIRSSMNQTGRNRIGESMEKTTRIESKIRPVSANNWDSFGKAKKALEGF